MTVARYDLNRCIGCQSCYNVCPMDVFRFDADAMKSVIAYPENCQNCGQCYVNCPGYSLVLTYDVYGYSMSTNRAPSALPKRYQAVTPVGDQANVPWDLNPPVDEEEEAAEGERSSRG